MLSDMSSVDFSEIMPRVASFSVRTSMICVLMACSIVFSGCQVLVSNDDTQKVNPALAASTRTALAAEYIRSNQLDAAERSLQQALKADPNSAEAHHMMAILLQKEGSTANLKKAEHFFKKAIRLQPDFAQAYNNYGVFLKSQNRYKEAVNAFEVAGETLGYNGRIQSLENLGRTALLNEDLPRAKKAFERAITGDENSIISYLELSDIHIQLKQIELAQAYFERYLTLLGNEKLGARSLLLGVKISSGLGNQTLAYKYYQQLARLHANSLEHTYATQLLKGK